MDEDYFFVDYELEGVVFFDRIDPLYDVYLQAEILEVDIGPPPAEGNYDRNRISVSYGGPKNKPEYNNFE